MATGLLVVMGAVAAAQAMAMSKVVVQALVAQAMDQMRVMVARVVLRVAAARAMAMKPMAVARGMAMGKVVVQALAAQVMERKKAMAMSKVAAQALAALAMAVSKVAIPPRAKPPTRLKCQSLLLKMCLGPVRRKKSKSLKFSGSQVGFSFGTGGLSMWM